MIIYYVINNIFNTSIINMKKNIPYFKFEIAPMLKKTNKHCRYFYRKLTKKSLLYTEMIHCNFIKKNPVILLENKNIDNIVLQIAGNNPKLLSLCARKAEKIGYKEINLNLGCPSLRAQKNNFGACLMYKPLIVSDCIKSMSDNVSIPITVKMRIGINNNNNYDFLYKFIDLLINSGCKRFIIHARTALLYKNINTKKNLIIPKLNYKIIYKIKKSFSNIKISINGGIKTLLDIKKHLKYVDGVMMGREIFKNPMMLVDIDKFIYHNKSFIKNPIIIVESMFSYIEKELKKGTSLITIIKPLLNIFYGIYGAHNFKNFIFNQKKNNLDVLKKALSFIRIKE
ncbi:tRNA dihydrouridine(20/20a) synthase DusA [Enterobacteriaceae endosymbiont of Donacia bicoloricornis]|uniref:tRNA dihydrouridine(20/20a) synthase DusA n=1 Tax=Enterobacteriaceae endosymbiont of Donacia bicoloricornis TaxID=2675772 RepID=UPI001448CB10|nr:tRNA dihydrouridine(20/20a) synthase DusA [Enterobacteriaceae endosymbiont of Donacia bicoloricornis]QJC37580.1 tRNA dihydrouridine(20/20a) synthase DusA [Enterobacteriaceae endosymbiont of Donacia bicoloricornis]